MPVLNGMEASKKIFELCKEVKQKPVILGLTGDADEDMHSAAHEAGMAEICIV